MKCSLLWLLCFEEKKEQNLKNRDQMETKLKDESCDEAVSG